MSARRTSRTNFKETEALQVDGRESKWWGKIITSHRHQDLQTEFLFATLALPLSSQMIIHIIIIHLS